MMKQIVDDRFTRSGG